jgi:hypothetical protein
MATVAPLLRLYDPVDKYYRVILRKDNDWEEMSAIIKYPGKDQIVISIYYELPVMLQRVMKQRWVSGTDRF